MYEVSLQENVALTINALAGAKSSEGRSRVHPLIETSIFSTDVFGNFTKETFYTSA